MGWFGFNGGSQLALSSAADATAIGTVFVNTNAAAAAGVVGALLVSKLTWGKADLTMILNGAPRRSGRHHRRPGLPSPLFASLIGALAGALVVYAIVAFDRLKIDDPVGAISVHGVCGLFGLMVVPFSNTSATFGAQLLGAATIFGWVFVVSLVVWSLLQGHHGPAGQRRGRDDGCGCPRVRHRCLPRVRQRQIQHLSTPSACGAGDTSGPVFWRPQRPLKAG